MHLELEEALDEHVTEEFPGLKPGDAHARLYQSGAYDKAVVVPVGIDLRERTPEHETWNSLSRVYAPFLRRALDKGYDVWMVRPFRTGQNIHEQAAELAQAIQFAADYYGLGPGEGKVIVAGYSLGGLTARLATTRWQVDNKWRADVSSAYPWSPLQDNPPVALVAFGDAPLEGAQGNLCVQDALWHFLQDGQAKMNLDSCAAQQLLFESYPGHLAPQSPTQNHDAFFLTGGAVTFRSHPGKAFCDHEVDGDWCICDPGPAVLKLNGNGFPSGLPLIAFSDGTLGPQQCYGDANDNTRQGLSVCTLLRPGVPRPVWPTTADPMFKIKDDVGLDHSCNAGPRDLDGGSRMGISSGTKQMECGSDVFSGICAGVDFYYSGVFIPYKSALPANAPFSDTSDNGFHGIHAFGYPGNLGFLMRKMDDITRTWPPLGGPRTLAQLADPTTGAPRASLSTPNVSRAGDTTLTISTSGPAPFPQYTTGTPAQYYDIATTAFFHAAVRDPIEVCISYAGIQFYDEEAISLFHYENIGWVDITTRRDPDNEKVCGVTTTLSPFALFEPVNHAPIATFQAGSSEALENGARPAVLVKLTTGDGGPTTRPLSVSYRAVEGTATAADYSPATGAVTFAPGTASGTTLAIPLSIVNDTLDEPDETFSLVLEPSSGIILGLAAHAVTIHDDDPPPAVSIGSATAIEPDENESAQAAFEVTLSTASGKPIQVTYGTRDDAGAPYPARTGTDYQAVGAQTLTLVPGETVKTALVTVNGDLVDEWDETYLVELRTPVNALPGSMLGRGTILDDDDPPIVRISDVTVLDNRPDNVAYFGVQLCSPTVASAECQPIGSEKPVSLQHATVDGSAHAGLDYVSTNGALAFPLETRKLTIGVPIIGDVEAEGSETFSVLLSGAVNSTIDDGEGVAVVQDGGKPPTCSGPLAPTGNALGLIISEIAPPLAIELYNPTASPIALAETREALRSNTSTADFAVPLARLGPSIVIPARGYAALRLPPSLGSMTSSGDMRLMADELDPSDANVLGYLCWGQWPTYTGPNWRGPCAASLTGGAIHRLPRTTGTDADSYDTVSPPSPQSCSAVYTVTKTADTNDGICDADCSLREAVAAATNAPGPDVVVVPKRLTATSAVDPYILTESITIPGAPDGTNELSILGQGAKTTVIDGGAAIGGGVIGGGVTGGGAIGGGVTGIGVIGGVGVCEAERVFDILADARVLISGVTIRNGGTAAFGSDGGGIRAAGDLTLLDAAITDSTARSGGGLAFVGGPGRRLTVERTTLSGNHAALDGGGLLVSCDDCLVTMRNATLSTNSAGSAGGGLYAVGSPQALLASSTVTLNTAGDQFGNGGGMALPQGQMEVQNSILAGNMSLVGPDCSGSFTSKGYNLVGNTSGCQIISGDGESSSVDNARLGPLADNRGPTQTHMPQSGSPAIDQANPIPPGSTDVACDVRDQRSYARPWNGGGLGGSRCDKGSVEVCIPSFDDLPSTSPYYRFAAELYCRSVSAGCGAAPPRFCPTQEVTRAQIAVFLTVAMAEQESGALYDAYFDDVPDDAFAPFINRIRELGVTSGCGTRAYCPNSPVSRAQAAVFLVTAMGERPSTVVFNAYFDDLYDGTPQNDYRAYAPFINRLKELGITGGCGARAYCPADGVSRQAMAVFLVQAFFQ